MGGSTSLVGFLQRAIGYCLSGVTSDKALFVLYGASGDNGKSTLVDVIQLLLGDYAMRTPTDTFLRKREGAIPNDIARLKGARFVWASESERGARLSESLLKEITGGDRLAARFMRGEFFEFYPEFKLWLATNHKPTVSGDRAIWNRIKLVPFEVSIPKDQQKPRHVVMEMFRAELPGILNWALQGCMDWQRRGLGVPQEVVAATQQYQAEQDTLAAFLADTCVVAQSASVPAGRLYQAYRRWADNSGEAPLTLKGFAAQLAERGFKKTRTRDGMIYHGIGAAGVASEAGDPRMCDRNGNHPLYHSEVM
jgi:putative DNA primase/helicase